MFEDRIEIGSRIVGTLERAAQAVFKSWFVDFDPVIDNALAAGNEIPEPFQARAVARLGLGEARKPLPEEMRAEFPNEFEFRNEVGWVPRGWTSVPFSSMAKLVTSSVKPFESPTDLWEHFSIPAFDAGQEPSLELGAAIKSGKYNVAQDAILVSKLKPETRRIWWARPANPDVAICSTEFMQFVPIQADSRGYIYCLIGSEEFQRGIASRVTGSTGSRQRAQPRSVHGMSVLNPGPILMSRFSSLAAGAIESISSKIAESATLAVVRDTLLPELLSGELTLPTAEKLAADVL